MSDAACSCGVLCQDLGSDGGCRYVYFDRLVKWLETVERSSECRYTRIGAIGQLEAAKRQRKALAPQDGGRGQS